MDIKDFIDTTKYYLREVKKGKEKIGSVNIKLLQEHNGIIPCYLNINNENLLGNIIYNDEKSLSLYLIAGEIYNLFNVNAPLNYYLYNDEGKKAVLSLNNQKERETETTTEEILMNIVNEIKRGIITIPLYLKDYLNILKNKKVKNDEEIVTLIEIGVQTIGKKYNLPEKDTQKLLQKFLELIIIDYITLNTNRNTNTYGFLIDKIKNKVNLTANYVRANMIDSNMYNLNGINMEFSKILHVLFNNYYDYIKALVISIIDNRSVYEKCVDLIVDANTSVNYNEEIKEKISNRLDDLLLLDNEIDKRNISKIDLVLTKTNVNLKIVNKTSEIMLKYQNYEPEVIEPEESKLIINYEKSPKTKSYSILHLICIVLVIIVIMVLIFLILKNMWYNNT